MPIHETDLLQTRSCEAPAVDALVQAQVALRLVSSLVDHLAEAGVLKAGDGARIAESAAQQAESGAHSRREDIAEALRRIVAT